MMPLKRYGKFFFGGKGWRELGLTNSIKTGFEKCQNEILDMTVLFTIILIIDLT